jgi:hypothetical protein
MTRTHCARGVRDTDAREGQPATVEKHETRAHMRDIVKRHGQESRCSTRLWLPQRNVCDGNCAVQIRVPWYERATAINDVPPGRVPPAFISEDRDVRGNIIAGKGS